MKPLHASVFLLCVCLPNAHAEPIVVWNFNDASNSVNSPANTAALFSPDHGFGTMNSNFTATAITAFNGTTLNAFPGDVAGQALALQGGSSNTNNGRFLQFGADLTGFNNAVVSFAIQNSGSGFNSNQFQYSLDGVTFVNFGALFSPPLSFGLTSFDLSGIGGLSDNPNASFRIVFDGASAANGLGNNRIDNLTISATALPAPEPPTWIIGAMLAVMLGLVMRCRSLRALRTIRSSIG